MKNAIWAGRAESAAAVVTEPKEVRTLSENKCSVRQRKGQQVGLVGIAVNALLFLIKYIVGLAGNSMSVLADALNNLTDCASAFATLIGFRICGKQADDKHPNGYGRMEYISGLIVALFIMATAISFGKSAVVRIFKPQAPEMSAVAIGLLVVAIGMKAALACYTHAVNKKVESATLEAMFQDSISDAVMTGVTIIPLLLSRFTRIPLDGIVGLLIAGMILWSGYKCFREQLDLLLGSEDDRTLTELVRQILLTRSCVFRDVISVTSFDYGPEKRLAFIQVELSMSPQLVEVQEEIEDMEMSLKVLLNLDATIYWNSPSSSGLEEIPKSQAVDEKKAAWLCGSKL